MEKEILKKREEIYLYASRVVSCNPWSRFGEKDLFVFLTKDKKEEHFFCFLEESCGDCAIAFYRNGNECFNAQVRLHGANPMVISSVICSTWQNLQRPIQIKNLCNSLLHKFPEDIM